MKFIAKYLDFHYFVTRYRFIGYLINNSLRSNSLSDHAYCIGRVPHEIVIGLIFSCKITYESSIRSNPSLLEPSASFRSRNPCPGKFRGIHFLIHAKIVIL